jgi:hypothetical protein
VFSKDDLDHALNALDLIFQDEEMPAGKAKFRQSEIVERLRERNITPALALALIDDLLRRKVFSAGSSIVKLRIFTRFDGRMTDEVTPDRYLHTTRKQWYTFLEKVKTSAGSTARIIAMGRRQYRVGEHSPITVSQREDTILQAFLKPAPLATMDYRTLCDRSGYEDAHRILKGLKTKYKGVFAPAIILPGGKGKGGYAVNIAPA